MVDHPILFSAPMIRALLAGRKSQTRRLLTKRNTWFDGGKWPNWLGPEGFLWNQAWVDAGPSPAGNTGPYLKLPVTGIPPNPNAPDEQTVHRIYPRVQPGDQLWVREAWRPTFAAEGYREDIGRVARPSDFDPTMTAVEYLADDTHELNGQNRPGIHMPRWASRLTLTVTEVRVQRLHDITEADALAEGIAPDSDGWFRVTGDRGNVIGTLDAVSAYACLWNSLHGNDAWQADPWVGATSFDVQHGNIDNLAEDA